MLSFISYEKFNEKALSGPGVPLSAIFKIGDIVDEKIVDEFRDDVPPVYYDASLMQMGEEYIYAKNDEGVSQPCYITFSFDNKDWMFCGACFENSVINRCDEFEYVPVAVGQYCVDKFDSEYIRAAERLYADAKKGVDITGLSVIDNYMEFDAFSMAGYWISTHDDEALEKFQENWEEYQEEEFYKPVLHLLEQKDNEFESIFWNSNEAQQSRALGDVDALIANASGRSKETSGEKDVGKTNKEMDL